MRRPLTLQEAWNRLEDPHTCGRCSHIRSRLEKMLGDAGSNPTVPLSTIMGLQVYCKGEKAWVQPLERACALWKPHGRDRVIMVEWK